MATTVTEKDLNEVQCYDFSIQTLANGQDVLIMICKDKAGASKLMEIFRNNAYDLRIIEKEDTANYSFLFDFIDTSIGMGLDTGANETNYPPLKKLKEGKINFITTGVWTGRSEKGRLCEYDPNAMRLKKFDMADSFKQANDVQFVAGVKGNEPSVVVLTYDDYPHIFRVEADDAYNRLKDMAVSKPLLEINPVSADKVNLRIWDILINLDIRFDGLNYSKQQLKEFIAKTGANDSFAFAIGFRPKGHTRVAIASTKREGFEFITLAGYTCKK